MTLECVLCGVSGPQVRPRMIEWAKPIGGVRFEVMPVCHDSRQCRQRVEQLDGEWPLAETSRTKETA